jgi:glycosyltransferase involved in cell wall biosynthesis
LISVVIPTLDSQRVLGPCLGALSPAVMQGLLREVIFADGGSTDETATIADATGASFLQAPPGEGSRLAAGLRAARGPWILVLTPGAIPDEGWVRHAERHMRTEPRAAAWFAAPPRTLNALRLRLLGLPRHASALLLPQLLCRDASALPAHGPAIPALGRLIGKSRLRALPITVELPAAP